MQCGHAGQLAGLNFLLWPSWHVILVPLRVTSQTAVLQCRSCCSQAVKCWPSVWQHVLQRGHTSCRHLCLTPSWLCWRWTLQLTDMVSSRNTVITASGQLYPSCLAVFCDGSAIMLNAVPVHSCCHVCLYRSVSGKFGFLYQIEVSVLCDGPAILLNAASVHSCCHMCLNSYCIR